MMALMGLIAYPGRVRAKKLRFAGHDLLGISDRERRRLVGKDMAMIFQDPMTSLNPVKSIGWQLEEAVLIHHDVSRKEARARAVAILKQVEIPRAEQRIDDYPHQFSGGMHQRAMIAMALACEPKLLIADEPTTALDVTIQAQILDLLRDLRTRLGLALLLITHDLGVVAEMADRVAVMYAGRIVEEAPVRDLFRDPRHPYTRGLLAALPRIDAPVAALPVLDRDPAWLELL
jgi:dipeptide transport system ATP-binding protein